MGETMSLEETARRVASYVLQMRDAAKLCEYILSHLQTVEMLAYQRASALCQEHAGLTSSPSSQLSLITAATDILNLADGGSGG